MTHKTITLIRHAKTTYPDATLPPEDPCIIPLDSQLVTSMAKNLSQEADWYVSPLKRCCQTYDALLNAGAAPVSTTLDASLKEQNFGDWHGKKIAEIWQDIAHLPSTNWHFLHPKIKPPHGESFEDLVARLEDFMQKIKTNNSQEIIILAHSMVIKALIGMAMQDNINPHASPQKWDYHSMLAVDIQPFSLTQLTFLVDANRLRKKNRWMLNILNQYCF